MTLCPRRLESWPVALLLIGCVTLAPFSMDMFLPSMPSMLALLQTDAATLQLAVTLFMVCYAGSQLLYGSASDRFGRRPVLLFGLGLYTIGGLVCLVAPTVGVLLLGRVVQGMAAGAGPSVGRAVVRDIYGKERAATILSYMTVVQSLAPMTAPVIGGFVQAHFGWRGVFVVLASMGLIYVTSVALAIPETNAHPDPAALQPLGLLRNYRTLLGDRAFLGYATIIGLTFSGQLVFITSSSFVMITVLGLSPQQFGLAFGFAALGLTTGAFLAARLVHRIGMNRVIGLGSALSTLAALTMLGLAWQSGGTTWGVLLPMYFYAVGGSLIRPPATAGAIVPWHQMAGLASALVGFVQIASASLYVFLFGLWFDGSPAGMAMGISVAAVMAQISFFLLVSHRREAVPSSAPPR